MALLFLKFFLQNINIKLLYVNFFFIWLVEKIEIVQKFKKFFFNIKAKTLSFDIEIRKIGSTIAIDRFLFLKFNCFGLLANFLTLTEVLVLL